MQFKLIVNMNNSAFDDEPIEELTRCLKHTIRMLRELPRVKEIPIIDHNGNRVGTGEFCNYEG